MHIRETNIFGAHEVVPQVFHDDRGSFQEIWNHATWAGFGLDAAFVQDNLSVSKKRGTLRGLHAQAPPFAQTKLVRCVRGAVRDIVVDIRRGSPSFGNHFAITLSAVDGNQLFIPAGCLHGFLTLSDDTAFSYKCSAPYNAASEISVRFHDPELVIDWGCDGAPILSEKDANAGFLKDLINPFTFEPQKQSA